MRDGKSAHEKFFADIILNSIDAIIGLDTEQNIFLWNKGAENIFGYGTDEIKGKPFNILLPEHIINAGEPQMILDEVKKNGFIANFETERISKQGRQIFVSITRYAIFNDDGGPLGSVGIVRDITKEKKLEKELREKENLALIGEVVSSIAHNLSNPLNIISGNADYLLLDRKDTDEGYEELKIILDETTRITKSIRQILNFSRPGNLMKEGADINEVVKSAVDKAGISKGKKNIEIKKSFPKNLPEVRIDKERIQDVLINILTNAIQAIPSDGLISVSTSSTEGEVQIKISDTGAGIPKENLDKIFKPFFSTKDYGKGTGLGLSFANRVIREHEGKIEVSSSPGKGTTFTITLPI
jgi:two-component system sensor histidine kinase HydH